MPETPISSLPKRKLLLQDAVPEFDAHGFFSATPETETFDAFWNHELVLVLGPPWMGKTFVSKQLKLHLDRVAQVPSEGPFGTFVHRTDFEEESHEEILPPWWQDWIGSDARACWIIDAVDEDGRTGSKETRRILNTCGNLPPEKRAKLCCFMFGRENELPKQIEQRLGEIYGQPEPEEGRYCVVRLAPLDADMALDYLGSEDAFERVCKIIGDNGLQSVAGYPCVIDRLANQELGVQLNELIVWKQVLHELLRDKRAESSATYTRSSALQFDAAARLAVILTFSECDAVRETDIYGDGPSIDSLIPQDHFKSKMLNAAGRDVLHSTIFRRTKRGYQFAQHHVQQWFAAFGVSDLSLNRLRPLLTDHKGKLLEVHNGVMGLLVRTTNQKAVKDWIVEQYGGIAPRPDAAAWSLAESLSALDRLQSIAKTTPWGLSLWNDRGLTFLTAPHLGAELVKRLTNRSLDHTERQLIVDVAMATRAKEIIPTAIKIAFDHSEDSRLRESAAALVMAIGDKANWLTFATEASKNNANDKLFNTMKATVAGKLYYEHIWDFDTTVRALPADDPRSRTLFYRLEKDMTIDDARRFLQSTDNVNRLSPELEAARENRQFRWVQLGVKAIELVAKQPNLLPSDYKLLLPILLEQHRRRWRYYDDLNLLTVIAGDSNARRALLRSIIGEPMEIVDRAPWQVRSLIVPEDLLWLIPIAEAEHERHPWIWRCVLQVAQWNATAPEIRERVRTIAMDKVPGLLCEVEEEQANAIRDERERQNEERKLRKRRTVKTFSMVELIDQTLGSSSIPLCEKMRRLSWVCLTDKSGRPTNVAGNWEDVDDERRQKVLDICSRALVECVPTDIPTANSYSMSIVYEANCFAKLTEGPPAGYTLDAVQVSRWLQSVLVITVSQDDAILARCHSKEPAATEAVLIKEIKRCLSFQPYSVFWLESLPPTAWTPSFCETIAAIADEEQYVLQGRAGLLQTLFVYGNSHAMPVLTKWLQSPTIEQRRAAVDLLILKHPDLIWDEFARQTASDVKDTLLHMRSLSGHHNVPPPLSLWKATFIEQLHALLMQIFPPDTDPKRESGVAYGYGSEDAYRDLRRGLAPLLLSRGAVDDLAALDRMASSFPSTGIWYAQVKAEREAGSLLSDLLPKPAAPKTATIPFPKIVRLLDVSIYRLIRTTGDLLEALLEELTHISLDAQEHLSCLYYPRKATKQQRQVQKNLQEDALQAYFYCRLSDRLKDRVLDPDMKIILNREPLSTKDQRIDIKVQALTLAQEIATVIIELKWSNHPAVSTSLSTQLGQQYLVNASLTHGIYLVAWNVPGTWKDKNVDGPTDRQSPEAWRAALAAQARAFSASNATIVIVPNVVDLAWPPSRSIDKHKRRRRASRTERKNPKKRSNVSKAKQVYRRSRQKNR